MKRESQSLGRSGHSKQMHLLERWITIVQTSREITPARLMSMLRLTVGQYNQLKSWVN